MSGDTVAAVATAPGVGAVAIVRVSGPLAPSIAEAVLGRLPRPRQAELARFRASDGMTIDRGLALFFPAPGSYTGEDLLELQGHGSPVVCDLLLARCLELGARPARPGELTERAFLNGKLDLAQAEAVADLIESGSALAARLAMRSLDGAFSRRIRSLIESLTRARTYLEASLDFPDEDLDPTAQLRLREDLSALVADTRSVLAQAHQGQRIREGLKVVIAGPPNAGKSSLLNALAQSDVAIVTPIPGTTRDPLKLDIQVDGLPVHLVDTAGLRDSRDLVEQEGVKRARQHIAQADLVLWVYDATEPSHLPSPLELELPPEVPLTLVRNKIDLPGTCLPLPHPGLELISLSALTGEGLGDLRRHLRRRAGVETLGEGAFVARRRHLDALARGLAHLESAELAAAAGTPAELVALDLRASQEAFGEITGECTPDDLLGRIFSTFCIGK